MAKHSMCTSRNGSVRERCGLSHSYIQYLDFILYQGQLKGYFTIKQDGKLLPCSKGLGITFSVKVRIFNRLEYRNLRVFPGQTMSLKLLVRKQKTNNITSDSHIKPEENNQKPPTISIRSSPLPV